MVESPFIREDIMEPGPWRLERLTDPKPRAPVEEIEAVVRPSGRWLGTLTGADRDWAAPKALGYCFAVGPIDISILIKGMSTAAEDRDDTLGRTSTAKSVKSD